MLLAQLTSSRRTSYWNSVFSIQCIATVHRVIVLIIRETLRYSGVPTSNLHDLSTVPLSESRRSVEERLGQ